MIPLRLALPCLLALACVGCGDGESRGILITDGFVGINSDANQRKLVAENIRTSLDADLAPHWRSAVSINELPAWEDGLREMDGTWVWPAATVAVELTGDGSGAPCPLGDAEISQAIRAYFAKRLVRKAPSGACTVAVTRVQAAAPATAAAVAPASGPRTYTVQAGDTLADISSAFYGSPQHWRRIQAANPGLDAGALKPGTVLAIPAAP